MSHLIDTREVLISLATAALTAAEADAAHSDGLIFRPEWRPTPRTRGLTSQPQGTPPNAGDSWLSRIVNQLAQQDHPHLPLLPAKPAPPSISTPQTAGVPLLPPAPAPPPAPERPHPAQPQLQVDAVSELVKKNQDVFDKIINHPFPRALGNATASLDGFRYFMIQDKLYLETYTRLKMVAVAASPNFKDVEKFGFRHESSIEYVNKLKEICITMLGIPESTIDATLRSVQLDASENFYKTSIRQEDALLGYYVVLLPCILSYWRIAKRLMDDPSTVRNVIYHKAWTDTNYDSSSADKYTKFINENIMAKGGVDRWNHVFRIACMLEADLLNTGLQAPDPYHIIPDGTYCIHSSSLQSVVLAVQNIKDSLRSPLGKLLGGYFPGDAGSSVVGVNKTGGDNEKWHTVVTKDGYTFQNLGTGLYLGIATELEGRIPQGVTKPYHWWINPVPSEPSRGSPSYQIYDSANLKYTLHADMEALKSVGSTNFRYTPIIVRENLKVSCQMWSFNVVGPDDKSAESTHNILRDTIAKEIVNSSAKMDRAQFNKEIDVQIANILAWYEKELKDQWTTEEARREREKGTGNAELCKQLQKAQTMNAELEAERAIYMRENDILRQELEETRVAMGAARDAPGSKGAVVRKPVRIGIMGPTGIGKSSFIGLITGSKDIRSTTSKIGLFRYFEKDGRCVTFVDTPGFDNSLTDADILRKIASFLDVEFPGGHKLSGIIYLHQITDHRKGSISVHNFRMFRKLCGEDALKNVVVVTTRWEDIQEKDREAMGRRENELVNTKGNFFEPFIAAGGRFLRHDNTFESACRIMEKVLDSDPIKLEDTAAGSKLDGLSN